MINPSFLEHPRLCHINLDLGKRDKADAILSINILLHLPILMAQQTLALKHLEILAPPAKGYCTSKEGFYILEGYRPPGYIDVLWQLIPYT